MAKNEQQYPHISNREVRHGFKFLSGRAQTEGRTMLPLTRQKGQEAVTQYQTPGPGKKWGPWLKHPDPLFDGGECGRGRFHVMKKLSAVYAPRHWTIWWVEARGIVGEGHDKFGCAEIRLRAISAKAFHRMIRMGWAEYGNLEGAFLREADLRGAKLAVMNLEEIDFQSARLQRADLSSSKANWANFLGACLEGATALNLIARSANFTGARMSGADFTSANLENSIMRNTSLTDASFRGSDCPGVDFSNSVLRNASFEGANLIHADFFGCNLNGVNFTDASMRAADFRFTICNGLIYETKGESFRFKDALIPPQIAREFVKQGADLSEAILLEHDAEDNRLR